MTASASNLADGLSRHAEAVCRRYISNGRRSGGYWIVGDVRNAPGSSTFVRLRNGGFGKGVAGRWSDYVAPRFMLRIFDWALSRRRLTASTQHNASVPREVA